VVPGVLITIASWRAAFIVPGVICIAMAVVTAWNLRTGRIGDRPMPATPGVKAGRAEFWRVFSVLSVTMALEGVIWQAVMFGSVLVFETRFQTKDVLLLGLATSMIYVVSGVAQYALGRRIIDRYPLRSTYIVASALQVVAMLGLAMGNGYVALGGAIFSAVLGAAAGPVENIMIARYTPSKYHGLGFGAKFVVAFGASPLAILLIARVREATGTLDPLFYGLAGASVVITAFAMLLPRERTESTPPLAVPQPAPAE
jgi:FSR family fosmidomycin resistance protein-like MFS transporter